MIGLAGLVAAGLTLVGFFVPLAVGIPLWLLAAGALGFTLYFFRDPDRNPPPDPDREELLLSPADGTVVEIVEEEEPTYLQGPSTRLSIFLSPLDVHVNRIPADGVVEYEHYQPGEYYVAWHPKASEKNERSEIGVRHPSGRRVLFKQIAGAMARRIVYHVVEGDTVRAGDRYGIVKFGSRMDVHVPPDIELDVDVDDHVQGGKTVLGHFPVSGVQPAQADIEAKPEG